MASGEAGTDDGAQPDAGPTLNDVARAAEVSRQTVSNVLNAPERVRPETAARVRDKIDELGYRPHRHARNLKIQSSGCMGYQVDVPPPDSINPVLDRFLHALAGAARDAGYHVVLFAAEGPEDELAVYDELFGTRAVDGFVLSEVGYDDARALRLAQQRVPFVAFGRPEIGLPHAWVDVDGAAGTRSAVAHLAERGRRRIAFVGWPQGSATGDRRAEGYRSALAEAGLPHDPDLEIRVENAVHTGARALDALLALPEPPDGVVAVSDLLAVGVLRRAGERGLQAGRDLGVTGFDDTPVARLTQPPLTSLRQPLEDAARRIVTTLVGLLAGDPLDPAGTLLAPELVVRDTS